MSKGKISIFISLFIMFVIAIIPRGGGICFAEEINVIQPLYPSQGYSEEMNGISYYWEDGRCLARGLSDGYSQLKLFFNMNEMPAGMIAGEVYGVYCTTTDKNLRFSIVFYSNQENIKELYFTDNSVFSVPDDAEGCLIRYWVNKNVRVDAEISARVVFKESQQTATQNTINNYNSYTTEHYSNTYNMQSYPDIIVDSNYFVTSPGDGSDMTAAIQSMLNSTGVCRLGPGDFYVSGIEIPNYGMLIGSGYSTRLILNADVEKGYAVKLKNYGCVKDIRIIGSLADIKPDSTLGDRHGILFEGTADNQDEVVSFYRSMIENCVINDFNGGGITCYNTGLSPSANLIVSDVRVIRCGAGINISYFSEYHRWTNICVTSCYYGCICNGGNNNFVNCDFSENVTGLLIDDSMGQSRNNTHGTFDACSFNHSNRNEGIAIQILGADNGEIFTGCQVFYGKIRVEDSTGIRFCSCNFGPQVPIEVNRSTAVVFSDCIIFSNEASPIEQEDNISLNFIDCINKNGTTYDPLN